MISSMSSIHPGASLGSGVQVDPFTMIHEDVIIGDNTWIGSNVTIYPGARIEKTVRFFQGQSLQEFLKI